MNLKKILTALLGLYGGLALAQAQTQTPLQPSEPPTASVRAGVLGKPFEGRRTVDESQPRIVVHSQSRIVVYRLEDVSLAGATSIFVNGTYHASLVNGAYSELCYGTGLVEFGARQAVVGLRPKDRPDSVLATSLIGGQKYYFRVREHEGGPVLQAIEAVKAEEELLGKRLQIHTISRAAQACIEVKEMPKVSLLH